MSITPGQENRNVVPRWRTFDEAAESGELDSWKPPREASDIDRFNNPDSEQKQAFASAPGFFSAGDLLSQQLASGTRSEPFEEALAIARASGEEHVLTKIDSEREYKYEAHLEPSDEPSLKHDFENWSARARESRVTLANQPHNAVRWVDLALAHVNLGSLEKAERDMRVAINLAPDNRHVIRSAVRLYVLLGDTRAARGILRGDPVDPWLMSSELALAAVDDRPARSAKNARRLITDSSVAPWHLSELLSALATLEFRSGSTKNARRLGQIALEDPTENAVAQATWMFNHGVSIELSDAMQLPRSHEARAVEYANEGKYEEAVYEGVRWLADQTFAPEPALFVSFLASACLDNHELAAAVAIKGLLGSPNDQMLRNNLIFALASSGEVAKAAAELAAVVEPSDAIKRSALTATRGLVAFRQGHIDDGRRYYRTAVNNFTRRSDFDRAAFACLFWAREEGIAQSEQASLVAAEGRRLAERSSSPELAVLKNRVLGALRSG